MAALAKDTPDVVVLVTEPEPVLIALEAKMYDRPSKAELLKQLAAQKLNSISCVPTWPTIWRCHESAWRIGRCCPRKAEQHDARPGDAHRHVGTNSCCVRRRRSALLSRRARCNSSRYDDLVSKWAGYQDAELAGAKLVTRWLAGDSTWPHMGAAGGLAGHRLSKAIADGSWATREFQCRHQELPGNNNWFTVEAFIQALASAGVDVDALRPKPADGL